MKVVLPLLVLLTAGLVVWALLPTEHALPSGPSTERVVDRAGPADPADPAAPADPDRPADPSAAGASPSATAGQPAPTRPAPLDLHRPLVPLPHGEVRPIEATRHGRAPDAPMPEVTYAVVKDPMRRYYGNLPRSGRMPGRITIEEILPPVVVEALGVPPRSQVIELGSHPTTGPQGFEEVLAMAEEYDGIFGITVVTPDGQRVRDYVRLTAPR